MIFLLHKNAEEVVRVIKGENELSIHNRKLVDAAWELAEKYPEELLIWCDENYFDLLQIDAFKEVFHHELVMASFSVDHQYFPAELGYIDTLPFLNVERKVKYPTWQMSTDVGGIKSAVLLEFREVFKRIEDFGYLLNSIGKLGQQNSLLCYSCPDLVKHKRGTSILSRSNRSQVFRFVYQHYNTSWVPVLLLCYMVFEKSFPFFPFIKSFFFKKYFQTEIDLSPFQKTSKSAGKTEKNIDVIIPTIGRPDHLKMVLEDLSVQKILPVKVIIVEQDPEPNSVSKLAYLKEQKWPFIIIHHFIHQTGACNARNMALRECDTELIFFADDDIRLNSDLLANTVRELEFYKVGAINLNCKQSGQETEFKKVKQWGSFGSGTSMVKSLYAKKCHFSPVFEHGYGEDADFGYQLRRKGCDILYHPKLELLHLKAPIGGLRIRTERPWDKTSHTFKPSPTIMVLAKRNYTPQQLMGYKVALFLKFYKNQSIKNPIKYLQTMQLHWKNSEDWADKLQEQSC